MLQAERDDSAQMETVLQAAADSVRRNGASRALEILVADAAPPPAMPDYRTHEARR
jgi:hypothetical protein